MLHRNREGPGDGSSRSWSDRRRVRGGLLGGKRAGDDSRCPAARAMPHTAITENVSRRTVAMRSFSALLRQQPAPQIPFRRLFAVNLQIEPAFLQIANLCGGEIERAADRAAVAFETVTSTIGGRKYPLALCGGERLSRRPQPSKVPVMDNFVPVSSATADPSLRPSPTRRRRWNRRKPRLVPQDILRGEAEPRAQGSDGHDYSYGPISRHSCPGRRCLDLLPECSNSAGGMAVGNNF